jgi:uncharacterized protein (DUF1697 family)
MSIHIALLLETETAQRLGLRVDYIVRTADQWRTIVARNPLRKQAEKDPSRFLVMCMKSEPTAKSISALEDCISGPEIVRHVGKELYVAYPAGIGKSKLSGTLIENKLCLRCTGRNWNTVLKLASLCEV